MCYNIQLSDYSEPNLHFCCLGPGRRPSAAVYQSHYSVGSGHAQEGPAGLARQSSKVRLH